MTFFYWTDPKALKIMQPLRAKKNCPKNIWVKKKIGQQKRAQKDHRPKNNLVESISLVQTYVWQKKNNKLQKNLKEN